jgi:hypothetical protein
MASRTHPLSKAWTGNAEPAANCCAYCGARDHGYDNCPKLRQKQHFASEEPNDAEQAGQKAPVPPAPRR